jgi:hypothetical protein
MRRDHMICMWICDSAVLGRESMGWVLKAKAAMHIAPGS